MIEPVSDAATPSDSVNSDSKSAKPKGLFCFVCCQQGAESTLKEALAGSDWRLAFSRPGFVTLKHGAETEFGQADLPSDTFCRTAAWSLGKLKGNDSTELVPQLTSLMSDLEVERFDAMHLWSRDRLPVGERGFHPGIEPLTEAVADLIHERLVASECVAAISANQVAREGDRILDIVMVEPDQWWVGWHQASSPTTRWPGGVFPMDREREVVSRAYFKTAEAIAWSEFPICPGDHFIEIGSAPGGSVQRLLELGMKVTGIDPADMDEAILSHKDFTHVRARGGDIKRRDYASGRWLLVDSNVRPEKTLTTVENVVQSRQTQFRGLLLTLKLSGYEHAKEIHEWVQRIRSWGYENIRTRQLALGKKEICVAVS